MSPDAYFSSSVSFFLQVKDILNLHYCQSKNFATASPAVLLSLSPRTSPLLLAACSNPGLAHNSAFSFCPLEDFTGLRKSFGVKCLFLSSCFRSNSADSDRLIANLVLKVGQHVTGKFHHTGDNVVGGWFSWSSVISRGTGGRTAIPSGPHMGANVATASLYTLSLLPLQEGRRNEVLLSKMKAKAS